MTEVSRLPHNGKTPQKDWYIGMAMMVKNCRAVGWVDGEIQHGVKDPWCERPMVSVIMFIELRFPPQNG